MEKTPTLRVVQEPQKLLREHIDVLRYLRDMGMERAALWPESVVDFLYKHKPRFVRLVKGHEDAVIEITTEGLTELAKKGV